MQHISVKASVRYIDCVNVNAEVREIVLRHTDENYSIKLKYVQPKVFAEEDVLTFINQDVKRIYDNAYSWWDNVDLGAYGEDECDYEGSMDFTVTYNGGGILAFLFQGDIYLGGSHGSPEQIGRVYELSTGKALGLCELLGKDEEAILQMVLEEWKLDKQKRGDEVYWDDFQPKYETVEDIRFYMNEEGIYVYFDVYEAACYADGFVEFLLANISEVIVLKNPAMG